MDRSVRSSRSGRKRFKRELTPTNSDDDIPEGSRNTQSADNLIMNVLPGQEPQEQNDGVPEKPPSDSKSYEVIHFPNGAKIILISENPTTPPPDLYDDMSFPCPTNSGSNIIGLRWEDDYCPRTRRVEGQNGCFQNDINSNTESMRKLVCAVRVGSGTIDNPPCFPDLAHLLEHVVLEGPEFHKFNSIIIRNRGRCNGKTNSESTTYDFNADVASTELKKLGDIVEAFTRVLNAPDFAIPDIRKELKAMDLEYNLFPRSVVQRQEMLLNTINPGNKDTPDHPLKKFALKNRRALTAKADDADHLRRVQRALQEFHKTHYVASNITIALQGQFSIPELRNVAVPFGDLRSGPYPLKPVVKHLMHPFNTPSFRRLYVVQVNQGTERAYLSWELPISAWEGYLHKPLQYISSIIASGKDNCLLHSLVRRQLAHSLWSGIQGGMGGIKTKFGVLFTILIEISSAGLDKILEIMGSVFAYIGKIKENGINLQEFRRQQMIREARQRLQTPFIPRGDNVVPVAEALHKYPTKHILNGESAFFEYKEDIILEALGALTPENVHVMVFSNHLGKQGPRDIKKLEGHSYVSIGIDKEMIARCRCRSAAAAERMQLPNGDNPYLPPEANLFLLNHVVSAQESESIESKLVSTTFTPLKLPVAISTFRATFKLDSIINNGERRAMLKMFTSWMRELMVKSIWEATEAGIHCSLEADSEGNFTLGVTGYDAGAEKLFSEFVDHLPNVPQLLGNNEPFLEPIKQQSLKMEHDRLLDPLQFGQSLLERACFKDSATILDVHSKMLAITNETLKAFMEKFLGDMKVKLDVSGNVTSEVARRATKRMRTACLREPSPRKASPKSSPRAARKSLRRPPAKPKPVDTLPVFSIPLGKHVWRVAALKTPSSDSYIHTYYQIDFTDDKGKKDGTRARKVKWAIVETIANMLKPDFYDLIRGKPYAYNSSSGTKRKLNVMEFYAVLDSSYKMDTVDQSIDELLNTFYEEKLTKLSNEDFKEKWSQFCTATIDPPLPTLCEYNECFQDHFLPSGKKYRCLSVQVVGKKRDPFLPLDGTEECWKNFNRREQLKMLKAAPKRGEKYITDIKEFHKKK